MRWFLALQIQPGRGLECRIQVIVILSVSACVMVKCCISVINCKRQLELQYMFNLSRKRCSTQSLTQRAHACIKKGERLGSACSRWNVTSLVLDILNFTNMTNQVQEKREIRCQLMVIQILELAPITCFAEIFTKDRTYVKEMISMFGTV